MWYMIFDNRHCRIFAIQCLPYQGGDDLDCAPDMDLPYDDQAWVSFDQALKRFKIEWERFPWNIDAWNGWRWRWKIARRSTSRVYPRRWPRAAMTNIRAVEIDGEWWIRREDAAAVLREYHVFPIPRSVYTGPLLPMEKFWKLKARGKLSRREKKITASKMKLSRFYVRP